MAETTGGDSPSLAQRLNILFAMVTWTDDNGRRYEYSTAKVAEAVTEDSTDSTTLSRSYLAMLRNGAHSNPTLSVLKALAKFFDGHKEPGTAPITVEWLVGDESAEDARLRQRLADIQVRTIAMRAGAMTPAMRRQLLHIIDELTVDP